PAGDGGNLMATSPACALPDGRTDAATPHPTVEWAQGAARLAFKRLYRPNFFLLQRTCLNYPYWR
ncbi:MAG: hypothetical protein AAF074_20670, partial [Pseudomonadota bacterium]